MEAKLIKIDRNGSKHFEGDVPCPRCGGAGYYAIGILNGRPVLSPLDQGVCWKCGGSGTVHGKWIERTPEYQAKLDARRQAKLDAQYAEYERQRKEADAKAEAERLAEEARIKALKAISQHVGEVGQKLTIKATYVKTAHFSVKAFSGFGTETIYIHLFKDAEGNVLIWKTSAGLSHLEYGEPVEIRGTVKEHSVYKDEKQTVLTRCKVTAIGGEEA